MRRSSVAAKCGVNGANMIRSSSKHSNAVLCVRVVGIQLDVSRHRLVVALVGARGATAEFPHTEM